MHVDRNISFFIRRGAILMSDILYLQRYLTVFAYVASWLLLSIISFELFASEKPRQNILWLWIDDQSPWYGVYGDKLAQTPNLDSLAAEGVVFERAYAPNPVCSSSRSALITGAYSIRIGTHDHRSGRVSSYQIKLPEGFSTIPGLFRAEGYETFNNGKDDYNFSYSRAELYSINTEESIVWDRGSVKENPSGREAIQQKRQQDRKSQEKTNYGKGPRGGGDWRDVPNNLYFFGQTHLSGGKQIHRDLHQQLIEKGYRPIEASEVVVPPQYPDILEVRRHIANHYNSIQQTDYQLGQTIARLKSDGLWNNTVIFLFSDHGSDLPRSKEYCYVEGLHVPLIVVAPGMTDIVNPGTRRTDIVNLMDVTATSLALAGIQIPDSMDSKNLFAKSYSREYVFSSSDRSANVIDRIRSVIGSRFHYIKNFMTDRPLINWNHREMWALENDDHDSIFLKIRNLANEKKLSTAQAAPYGPRVNHELYDLRADPNEVVNLARDPRYSAQLKEMQNQLSAWIAETDDKGQYPRSQAAWDEIIDRIPSSWLRSPDFAKNN